MAATWKIEMLGTHRGSPDGHKVHEYHAGCIYTVGETITDTLARSFISAGWATEFMPEQRHILLNS